MTHTYDKLLINKNCIAIIPSLLMAFTMSACGGNNASQESEYTREENTAVAETIDENSSTLDNQEIDELVEENSDVMEESQEEVSSEDNTREEIDVIESDNTADDTLVVELDFALPSKA